EERFRAEEHAGRAVAALERHVVDERLLQRVQLVAAAKPLYRQDRSSVGEWRQEETATDWLGVHQDGARAANADAAGFARAAQPAAIAQHLQQRRVCRDVECEFLIIERESDGAVQATSPPTP